ncbi:MAG: YraN family protein [Lachnospiraceae bacterium]|nr:YraN family protein [Lachnospiraceae bacterium]
MHNNRKTGAKGESIAETELLKKGYNVIDKNFRGQNGEIDIIAEKDGVLVFIEVKLRKSLSKGLPREAVTLKKQERIIKTAEEYIYEKSVCNMDMRFDVAEVFCKNGSIYFNYIENAFSQR